jgi:hypothetical protein
MGALRLYLVVGFPTLSKPCRSLHRRDFRCGRSVRILSQSKPYDVLTTIRFLLWVFYFIYTSQFGQCRPRIYVRLISIFPCLFSKIVFWSPATSPSYPQLIIYQGRLTSKAFNKSEGRCRFGISPGEWVSLVQMPKVACICIT